MEAVQSYQQESTQGNTSTSMAKAASSTIATRSAISPTLALDRALPDEFRQQVHHSDQPSIGQAALM